jgi:hypothetical protein
MVRLSWNLSQRGLVGDALTALAISLVVALPVASESADARPAASQKADALLSGLVETNDRPGGTGGAERQNSF